MEDFAELNKIKVEILKKLRNDEIDMKISELRELSKKVIDSTSRDELVENYKKFDKEFEAFLDSYIVKLKKLYKIKKYLDLTTEDKEKIENEIAFYTDKLFEVYIIKKKMKHTLRAISRIRSKPCLNKHSKREENKNCALGKKRKQEEYIKKISQKLDKEKIEFKAGNLEFLRKMEEVLVHGKISELRELLSNRHKSGISKTIETVKANNEKLKNIFFNEYALNLEILLKKIKSTDLKDEKKTIIHNDINYYSKQINEFYLLNRDFHYIDILIKKDETAKKIRDLYKLCLPNANGEVDQTACNSVRDKEKKYTEEYQEYTEDYRKFTKEYQKFTEKYQKYTEEYPEEYPEEYQEFIEE